MEGVTWHSLLLRQMAPDDEWFRRNIPGCSVAVSRADTIFNNEVSKRNRRFGDDNVRCVSDGEQTQTGVSVLRD